MNIWDYVKGFSPNEKWGKPERMNGLLLLLLPIIRLEFLKEDANCRFIIHCGFEEDGHAPKSQHYRGNAVDFHIETSLPYSRQVEKMLVILDGLQVSNYVGLGIYPTWQHKGFHLDVRGSLSRWGYLGEKQVSYENALEVIT